MDIKEALETISDGHAIWRVGYAEEVCAALGVGFSEDLVQVYESDRHPLGVTMLHGPDRGVWSLDLARHVAERLGVEGQAREFRGRGSQAREYARVVAEKLGQPVS